MTKADLVEKVAREADMTKKDAEQLVEHRANSVRAYADSAIFHLKYSCDTYNILRIEEIENSRGCRHRERVNGNPRQHSGLAREVGKTLARL